MIGNTSKLTWKPLKKKVAPSDSFTCPYCGTFTSVTASFCLVNQDGVKKNHIYICLNCCFPVLKTIDSRFIPYAQYVPFEGIEHLPSNIEILYDECRKSLATQCYSAVILIARRLLMCIALDKGSDDKNSFQQHIDYLHQEEFIAKNDKNWIDIIRLQGNVVNHQAAIPTRDEAEKVAKCIRQILMSLYELQNLANKI